MSRLKFIPCGGFDLSAGEYLQLEVTDTGSGMTPETQAKVFEPFYTTKTAGHGLGLAVVHGIVRGLGGTIQLMSELGIGSTFVVTLPSVERETPGGSPTASRGWSATRGSVREGQRTCC